MQKKNKTVASNFNKPKATNLSIKIPKDKDKNKDNVTINSNDSLASSVINLKEKNFDLTELNNLLSENKIPTYKNTSTFQIDSLIYEHRESIFHGLLYHEGKNVEVFIKRYPFNTQEDLNVVLNEMNIILTLTNSKLAISKTISYLYGVYIDDAIGDENESDHFYTIYEYFPIHTTSLSLNLPNINYFQKLIIMKNILKFVLSMHSLGIIHRDLKLEYFFFDHKF